MKSCYLKRDITINCIGIVLWMKKRDGELILIRL